MTIATLALSAPIPASAWTNHPALRFYAKYGKAFGENINSTSPENFYNAKCKMYHVDHSVIEGAEEMWTFFKSLYGMIAKVTREIITMIAVSDDEAGTHRIHVELVTTLYPAEGRQPVAVPQTFVYVLGKADEGKGMDGLQFKELRNYYDYSLIKKALHGI